LDRPEQRPELGERPGYALLRQHERFHRTELGGRLHGLAVGAVGGVERSQREGPVQSDLQHDREAGPKVAGAQLAGWRCMAQHAACGTRQGGACAAEDGRRAAEGSAGANELERPRLQVASRSMAVLPPAPPGPLVSEQPFIGDLGRVQGEDAEAVRRLLPRRQARVELTLPGQRGTLDGHDVRTPSLDQGMHAALDPIGRKSALDLADPRLREHSSRILQRRPAWKPDQTRSLRLSSRGVAHKPDRGRASERPCA
jgi:hypothetical protein